jgi:hypothetical protein
MAHSSYQVERLIDRLRRLSDWLTWPAYRRWRGEDPVRVSRAAREAAPPSAPPRAEWPSLAAVRDWRRYPPQVEAERERRAGTFMRPPYVPFTEEAPAPRIPRLERETRRRRPRAMADAD